MRPKLNLLNRHIDLGVGKCNGYEHEEGKFAQRNIAAIARILETDMTRIHPMATRSRFRKAGIALSAALVLGGAFSGCTRIKDHEGFIIEDALVAQIQPGVDNKESVEAMLGKPSFTGMFGGNEYYYVSRDLRHIAFGTPKPSDQKIIKVTFNAAGGVSSIEQIGVDQVASISPNGDVTPSMGSNMGFFESIFDNMGAPGGSGTAEGSGDPTNR